MFKVAPNRLVKAAMTEHVCVFDPKTEVAHGMPNEALFRCVHTPLHHSPSVRCHSNQLIFCLTQTIFLTLTDCTLTLFLSRLYEEWSHGQYGSCASLCLVFIIACESPISHFWKLLIFDQLPAWPPLFLQPLIEDTKTNAYDSRDHYHRQRSGR